MSSDIPPNAELIRQFTAPGGVESLTWEVEAPTKLAARATARAATRIVRPGARNLLNPKVRSRQEAKQAKIRDFFPNSFKKEEWTIEVIVVK